MNRSTLNQLMMLNKDAFAVILRRYDLLRSISYIQPVGRRQLSIYTGCTEREVRSDSDALRLTGLVRSEAAGMIVTREGYKLLNELEEIMHDMSNTDSLANELKECYQLNNVDIVDGDVDSHMLIRRNIGLRAAMQLRKYFESYTNIALTGHDYVGMLVDGNFPAKIGNNVTLYPARTAQLNNEDINANTYCSRLGKKSGANFKLLHLGNKPSLAEIEKRYNDPDVLGIVKAVENADMLISGITSLKKSSLFNSMSVRAKDVLMQSEPCCELMGSFIKSDGKQINNAPLYSLSIDRISKYKVFMLLAAGHDEAEGIHALVMRFKNIHLITDSRTANRLIAYKLGK